MSADRPCPRTVPLVSSSVMASSPSETSYSPVPESVSTAIAPAPRPDPPRPRSWLMRSIVQKAGIAAVALALCCGGGGVAQNARNLRQYYSKTWTYDKKGEYHYRTFHYKVKRTDTEYRHQYVIYKPAVSRQYVYWFNPAPK